MYYAGESRGDEVCYAATSTAEGSLASARLSRCSNPLPKSASATYDITHVRDAAGGLVFWIDDTARISILSVAPTISRSLFLHPPRPPKFAIPPPSRICASISKPVRLTTPARSLGVVGRGVVMTGLVRCFCSATVAVPPVVERPDRFG